MQNIFISYARKDIGFVRRLAGDLEMAGYDVWWDISDLRGGDDWLRMIPAAIESSDSVIVVLSPNSIVSEWVRKEYTQALYLRKKIVPIMLERSSVPFALNTINYVDFTSGDYAKDLNNLLTALGYTGELPVVPGGGLPLMLRKYAIPIIIGVLILIALIPALIPTPPVPPPSTPSISPPTTAAMTLTLTDTPTVSPTASPTVTLTPSITFTSTTTLTPTPRPTFSASPTNPTFDMLIYCVNSLYANTINVRSGPGTNHAPLGEPLSVGACLFFSARNEAATWLQIAPLQLNPVLEQYAGGWIFRELLGLGTMGPIDLPAVTLTPTPTLSETPTVTPTFTRTPTDTPTLTSTPTP